MTLYDDAASSETLARLRSATDASAPLRRLVTAALAGPGDLEDTLNSVAAEPADDAPSGNVAPSERGGRVFLSRISVSSLRGIAEPVEIRLEPRPGLVVVCGRNGSGKSSFAEGAELAITGESKRLAQKWWKDGLQNVHRADPPYVEVDVHVDGIGDVLLTAAPGDGKTTPTRYAVQARTGAAFDLNTHGWLDAASRYQPVLTYTELADLASAQPKVLADSISNIIGLDGLTRTDKTLTDAITEHSRIPKAADDKLGALLRELSRDDTPRAAEIAKALRGDTPDLDGARRISAGGTGSVPATRATLEAWATLAAPPPEGVAEAAGRLGQAILDNEAATSTAAGRARQLVSILETVLQHREHDADPCPVCGVGVLDEAWGEDAAERLAQARADAKTADGAAAGLLTARTQLHALLVAPPPVLTGAPVNTVDPAAACTVWQRLAALRSASDSDLVEQAAAAATATDAAVAELATAAKAAVAEDDARWAPIAEQAADTIAALAAAAAERVHVRDLTEARDWLRETIDDIRNERFAEFKDQATEIWDALRQDSNVTLADLQLKGANTRRRVEFTLAVDDTPAPGAVLSQGELTALGLSVFLPRSTAEASPFRFVLVDDPVQSMDPTKVDALAQVLHDLAAERQVIVFTHDDRFLAALRRLGRHHTAYSVTRGRFSDVRVERTTDAVEQYLRDADALAKDTKGLPLDLVSITVSGICRDAIDHAATEAVFARYRREGRTLADAEHAVEKAQPTNRLLALALLGNANKSSRLDAALNRLLPGAAATVKACVEPVHEPDASTIGGLVAGVRSLIQALAEAAEAEPSPDDATGDPTAADPAEETAGNPTDDRPTSGRTL